jgi:hypothetical protein
VDLGWTNIPNGARYRAVIQRVDIGGLRQYSVVVAGRRGNVYGGQSTVAAIVGGAPRFKSAISAQNGIQTTATTSGLIDGYDSDQGPYSSATGDTVLITSNGPVTLNNSMVVRGDVTSTGSITNSFGVSGQIKPFAPPQPLNPILPCPAGGYTPSVPMNSRVNYSPVTGILYLEDNGVLTLSGSTQYHFKQLLVGNGATLTINGAGQRVDVFVEDWFGAAAGAIVNPSGKPTNLSIWACGSPATPALWYVPGGAGAYYSVYAPNHDIQMLGGGGGANNFYGAVVGANVVMPSAMRIHYDAALTRIPSTQLTIVPGSWAQLPAN